MLNPPDWRETARNRADDFAEMLGGKVHQISVVLDLARLPIVLYHKIAKAVEGFRIAVLSPLEVLIVTVVIEKLIAHSELRQQGLIAMRQFTVGMVGNDSELVDDGEQMGGLFVG